MEIRLSKALGPVKVALADVASQSAKRRLEMYGTNVPCKPGCSSCCSRLVRITMAEAIVLYEHLLQKGVWGAVSLEAKNQFQLAREVDGLSWFKLNQACCVLDPVTKKCRGYDARPAKCAAHFVLSDPALCSPWNASGGRYVSADMDDLVEKFYKRLVENTDGFGIFQLELALPVALLLAERISIQSGLDLEKAVSLLFQEYT